MKNLEQRLAKAEKQAERKPEDLHAELMRRLPDDILDALAEQRELTAEQMVRARLTAAAVLGIDLEARWRAAGCPDRTAQQGETE